MTHQAKHPSPELSVVCPVCHAAVGARCLVAKREGVGGYQWVEWTHVERKEKARKCSG